MPLRILDVDSFRQGLGFDGSSLRGWQGIAESDMLLMPDPATAIIDPFAVEPTISLVCEITDPLTLEPYSRDPRFVAQKAEAFLLETGIADAAYFGPEAEFFVFDSVSYSLETQRAHYEIDSEEAHWNATSRDSATSSARRGATSRFRPHDTLPTFARRWSCSSSSSASSASSITTKWQRPGSARSTCASRP